MIKLENKTGVQAPDGTYPFGKSLDRAGSTNGFPLNSANLEDYHQFFAKMFDESGVVANGLPDNDVNGWQLFEALQVVAQLASGGLTKIIPIGTWNMDTTGSIAVPHLLADHTKVRSVDVVIVDDALGNSFSLLMPDGGNYQISATNVDLIRNASGAFDTAFFSGAGNRGFITIKYVV